MIWYAFAVLLTLSLVFAFKADFTASGGEISHTNWATLSCICIAAAFICLALATWNADSACFLSPECVKSFR